jgi:ABC-2 type transport system permease protein
VASLAQRTPGRVWWRSFQTSAWLGWQIDSNWTEPLLFAIYSVAKPLALTAILVAMYAAALQGDLSAPAFSNLYVGSTFYLYVGAFMTGMAYAVIDDRERYRMLRAVYIAPIDVRWYLIGRGAARVLTSSLAVIVNLVIGVVLLNVSIDPSQIDWRLLVVAMAAGLAMLALLGLLLASITLLLGHMAWSIGDAVAATLYLFSSAAFPLNVLPSWLQVVGLALPFTYWLELVRRALLGPSHASALLSGFTSLEVLGILVGQTLVLVAVARLVFKGADHRARERGLIDRIGNY